MYEGSLATLSNRATWVDTVGLIDNETNEYIDISGATEIVVQVAPQQGGSFGGYGAGSVIGPLLTASLSNGKVKHVQLGVFEFAFERGELRSLCGGIYNVEITIDQHGETVSLVLGTVPIREGVVTIGS